MPKLDYVVRETGSNLGRNITITLASVLTVFISVLLVGAALMFNRAVENATQRWQGGIEFVVFMSVDANQDQVDAVANALEESPEIASVDYVDKEGAYDEFRTLFADSQEMIDSVAPDDLPSSFRVEPVDKNVEAVEALGSQFGDRSGVDSVVFASETIRFIQDISSRLTTGIFVVAAVLFVASGLLILNTIRMAMFARRREIEVMKLVGATNWFIRVPFMLEGLIQGFLGAIAAIGFLAVLRPFFLGWLPDSDDFPLIAGFTIGGAELISIFLLLGVAGILIGAIGAGIAVTRFLDV
jgi:cell division transport system permease protein